MTYVMMTITDGTSIGSVILQDGVPFTLRVQNDNDWPANFALRLDDEHLGRYSLILFS
jgi:hypothetical protein